MSLRTILGVAAVLGATDSASAATSRCWIDQGALVVSASFGDLAGDFLVDTAAPYSLINQTEAQAAGFDGDSASAPLRISTLKPRRVRLTVVSLDGLPQTDTAIIGVIGQDVLGARALEVRFSPCRFRLSRTSKTRAHGLRLRRQAGLPAVHAAYGDGQASRREPMLISTGRWESLIPRAGLSRTPAQGPQPAIRIRWLRVEGRTFSPASAALASAPVGTIGMSVLTQWRGMILTRDRLILER